MTSMKIGGGGTYERMAQLKRQFDEARADAGKSAGSSPFPAVSAGAEAPSEAEHAVKGGLGAVEAPANARTTSTSTSSRATSTCTRSPRT